MSRPCCLRYRMTNVKRILIISRGADSMTVRLRRRGHAFAFTDNCGSIPFVSPVVLPLAKLLHGRLQRRATFRR